MEESAKAAKRVIEQETLISIVEEEQVRGPSRRLAVRVHPCEAPSRQERLAREEESLRRPHTVSLRLPVPSAAQLIAGARQELDLVTFKVRISRTYHPPIVLP